MRHERVDLRGRQFWIPKSMALVEMYLMRPQAAGDERIVLVLFVPATGQF